MKEEDKELLLKDLCARLPYGVIIHLVEPNEDEELYCLNIPQEGLYTRSLEHNNVTTLSPIEDIKPYLRPISSMTQEEIDEYDKELSKDMDIIENGVIDKEKLIASNGNCSSMNFIPHYGNDWLNKKMFDYRDLIPMGLALEALEGMYNIK